jgi:hypothetical protein
MGSLADLPKLLGFFSYSRNDDEGDGGAVSVLANRIYRELRLQLGRSDEDSSLRKPLSLETYPSARFQIANSYFRGNQCPTRASGTLRRARVQEDGK